MLGFDSNLRRIIDNFAYPVYAVQQYEDVKCTCANETGKDADYNCHKCLGMGHKITIRKIKGVKQLTNKVSFRTYGVSENVNTAVFYFDCNYPVKIGNMIIDQDEVWIIQDSTPQYSDKRNIVCFLCTAVPIKAHTDIILKNFHEIVGV